MKRCMAFAGRNLKELLRDPLSYIFCVGFPLVMLIVMTLVNESIPAEAGMTIFRVDRLSPGIAVFGLTFIMLFTCLSVSKDRAGAFLVRLYASPMRPWDFIFGYMLPVFVLSLIQSIVTFAASVIIGIFTEVTLNIAGCLLAVVSLIPLSVMMISTGLLFGTLFSDKAAPGLCSIVISLASFLGGVWFDVENIDGVLYEICNALPFFHGTMAGRMAVATEIGSEYLTHLGMTAAYAVAVTAVSIYVFRRKMKADIS